MGKKKKKRRGTINILSLRRSLFYFLKELQCLPTMLPDFDQKASSYSEIHRSQYRMFVFHIKNNAPLKL